MNRLLEIALECPKYSDDVQFHCLFNTNIFVLQSTSKFRCSSTESTSHLPEAKREAAVRDLRELYPDLDGVGSCATHDDVPLQEEGKAQEEWRSTDPAS